MSIIYGYDVAPRDDPFVALARDAMRAVSDATFYRASDIINELSTPLLYLPSWMPFKKHMSKTQRLAQDMRDVPFNGVKKSMVRISLQHISLAVLKRFFEARRHGARIDCERPTDEARRRLRGTTEDDQRSCRLVVCGRCRQCRCLTKYSSSTN